MSMLHTIQDTQRRHRHLRRGQVWDRGARTVGFVASFAWMFILVASLIEEGFNTDDTEGLMLTGLVLACVFGVVIGFANSQIGGTITLVAGIALALFAAATAGRNHWLAVLISGAPFIASAVMFIISARIAAQPPNEI